MNIKIRQASLDDRNTLILYFKHYPDAALAHKRIEAFLTFGTTLIAFENKTIVGLLQWHIKEDPSAGVAEFEEIHVLITHQGRGIGTQLVKAGIDSVRRYFEAQQIIPRKIYLFVGSSNEAAHHLYQKCGFKPIASVGTLFSDTQVEELWSYSF